MNSPKCYKCKMIIDEVINDSCLPETDRTLYICTECSFPCKADAGWDNLSSGIIINDINKEIKNIFSMVGK